MVAILEESELLARFSLSDINSFYELEFTLGPSALRDELLKFDFQNSFESFTPIYKVANITVGSNYMGRAFIHIEEESFEEELSLF